VKGPRPATAREYLGPFYLGSNETVNNGIYTGDARDLAKGIPDESVDLIFCDPPYGLDSLWCYEWVASEARRILRPEGWLLAMCGSMYLNQVMHLLSKWMHYFWEFHVALGGRGAVWFRRGNNAIPIVVKSKPLLAFCQKDQWPLPRTSVLGTFGGTGEDKRYHIWGQDETSARYYIDCFTEQDDIVCDPFCGGGTTPAMARVLGRRYLCFEIDPVVARRARDRVRLTQPPLFVPEPEQAPLF
jgi:hypothetical protein